MPAAQPGSQWGPGRGREGRAAALMWSPVLDEKRPRKGLAIQPLRQSPVSSGMPLSTVTSLLQERARSMAYNVLLKMLRMPVARRWDCPLASFGPSAI